jgi:hypothetical protein
MSTMIPIAMFGLIPAVLAMFWLMPPRKAIIWAFLLAWLFLPMSGYKIPMLPGYTKVTAANLASFLGVFFFDFGRLQSFRLKWIDLPILTWCVAKMGASLTNGYDAYDGFSAIEYTLIIWGIPWLLGRLYFSDDQGIRELAIAIAIGGLVYVPLCLFEAKMSPQLQTWVYGIPRIDWLETKRFGGWRPTVFMQHGLMVGMWMCMSGLIAWWLWSLRSVRIIWKLPASWVAICVIATGVICRSFGAILLMVLGILSLWASRRFKRSFFLWALYAFVPLYIVLRLTGTWSGANLIALSSAMGGTDRASSLQVRLASEDQFIHAGLQKPLFGFHGWYNTVQLQDKDSKAGIPDALWMIEFTGSGLLGLGSLTCYLMLPVARAWKQLKRTDWTNANVLPAVGIAMLVMLSMFDNLFNAMLNPIFMLSAGALSSWQLRRTLPQMVRRTQAGRGELLKNRRPGTPACRQP